MLESNPRIFVEKSTFETSRRIRGRNHTLLVSFVRLSHEAQPTDGMHCGFLASHQYGIREQIALQPTHHGNLVVCSTAGQHRSTSETKHLRAVVVPAPPRHCPPGDRLEVVQTEHFLEVRLDILLRLGIARCRCGLLRYRDGRGWRGWRLDSWLWQRIGNKLA